MAAPVLPPPPFDTPLLQADGKTSPPWVNWLRQLWDELHEGEKSFAGGASRSANQTIPNNTVTRVQMDTLDFSEGAAGAFGSAGGGAYERWTAAEPGQYSVEAKVGLNAGGTNSDLQAQLLKNGALVKILGNASSSSAAWTYNVDVGGGCLVDLVAGDYLELHVYQLSGGSMVIGDATRSFLHVHKVPAV